MKIAIVGNNQERYWSPVTYCILTLIKQHDIVFQAQDDYGIEYLDNLVGTEKEPDIILCIDDGSPQKMNHSRKTSKIVKVIWISDTHSCDQTWVDMRVDMSRQFDYVFVCQKNAVDLFRDKLGHDQVGWLPHAVYERDFLFQDREKIYDIGAVSYMNHKRDILYPMLDYKFNFSNVNGLWSLQVSKFINQCKIGINLTLSNDLVNMRTMEVMACRVPLLQNRCSIGEDSSDNGLFDLFEDGKDLYTYENYDEAVTKIQWILEHPEDAAKVALNGWTKILDNHTYSKRLKTILKVVGLE